MISLLIGFFIGISLYIAIVHSFIKLEDAIFTFKYRNIGEFADEFAFIIDDTVINKGGTK